MVEMDALAGHVQRKTVALTAHPLFALARRRPVGGGARNQRRQLQVIAPVERQLDDRAVFNHGADGRILGLNQRRVSHHLEGFREITHIHRKGEPVRAAHLHHDARPVDSSESRQLGFQVVRPGRDGGDHIQANLVGLHDSNDIRRLVGQRHRHAGHGQPARVDDGPADFARWRLRVNGGADREKEQKQRDACGSTGHGASSFGSTLRAECSMASRSSTAWRASIRR